MGSVVLVTVVVVVLATVVAVVELVVVVCAQDAPTGTASSATVSPIKSNLRRIAASPVTARCLMPWDDIRKAHCAYRHTGRRT